MPIILCVHTPVVKDKTESRKTNSFSGKANMFIKHFNIRPGKKKSYNTRKKKLSLNVHGQAIYNLQSHTSFIEPRSWDITQDRQTCMVEEQKKKMKQHCRSTDGLTFLNTVQNSFLSLYLRMKGSCSDIPSFQLSLLVFYYYFYFVAITLLLFFSSHCQQRKTKRYTPSTHRFTHSPVTVSTLAWRKHVSDDALKPKYELL